MEVRVLLVNSCSVEAFEETPEQETQGHEDESLFASFQVFGSLCYGKDQST